MAYEFMWLVKNLRGGLNIMATDTWPKPSPPWLSKTLVKERRHKNSICKQIFCFLAFYVFDKAKHYLNDVLEIFLWVFWCNNQGTCNLKNGLCGFVPKNTDCWNALSFWFWIWQMNSCFPHYIFKSSWSALKYNQFAGWNYKPCQKSSVYEN